jgi:hypothetical protein
MPLPTIPAQPADFPMPQTAQMIFTYGNIVPLLLIGILAFRYAQRNRTMLPFQLLLGGLICMFIEPVVDVLGLCYFPHQGSWAAFRAFNVTIPLYMVPVYMWFVGGQAFLVYQMLERGMTRSQIFRIWLTLALVNGALETPGLLIGVYTYYGDQPFQFLGLPWWWTFGNALMPITAAVLVFKLRPYLTGYKSLLIIPLVPMADGLTNGAIGWPTWLALNSGLGYAATYPAAIISFGFAWIATYVLAIVVDPPKPQH